METEIVSEEVMANLRKDPEYSALKPEDIAEAVKYVLSTPPNCQVNMNFVG